MILHLLSLQSIIVLARNDGALRVDSGTFNDDNVSGDDETTTTDNGRSTINSSGSGSSSHRSNGSSGNSGSNHSNNHCSRGGGMESSVKASGFINRVPSSCRCSTEGAGQTCPPSER